MSLLTIKIMESQYIYIYKIRKLSFLFSFTIRKLIYKSSTNVPAFNTKLRSSWQYSIIGIKSFPTVFHLHICLKTSRVCGSSRLKNLSKSFKLSAKINSFDISKLKKNRRIYSTHANDFLHENLVVKNAQ